MVTYADFMPLAPEIFLLGATCAIVLVDLFVSAQRRGLVHFLALMTLIATGIITFRAAGDVAGPVSAFAGMFVRDTMGDVLKLAVYVVSGAALIYAKPYLIGRGLFKGEFYVLVLLAVLGMMLLISAGSLVMIYMGLELLALSSYALVALDRDSPSVSEAAMKYFVLGSLASGMLLYGMSLIYGATGSLDLAVIHQAAASPGQHTLLLTGLVFVMAGIAFKFGAAPFHMWLPDVYQGAPTAVTLFIGSAPKLAAFAMAYRLLEGAAGPLDGYWRDMVALLALLSLATGNLLALMQTNLKRMLAYSTISHIGFLFLGLSAGSAQGYAAAMFYAISYALMSAAAFAAIIALSRRGFEAENIEDFKGLNSTNPWLAAMVLCVMASLAGIPFFLGFWAKVAVLRAAIEGGALWLAITGLVFAVIGAFYYLRVIKVMYFDEPGAAPAGEGHAGMADPQFRWLLSVNALLLLVLGFGWDPLMYWCQQAFVS